jgi:ABC-type antimicrobial peptide transport system permease subunit
VKQSRFDKQSLFQENGHMLGRIIVGLVIGMFAGFVLSSDSTLLRDKRNLMLAFLALIIIAFIGSSFMFGALYGVMAIGEVALGHWLIRKIKTMPKS